MKIIQTKNNKQLMIRDAQSTDAEQMFHLFNQVAKETDFLPFGEGEFGKLIADIKNHIESCTNKDNAIYIVAEIDQKIVGYLSFEGGWRPRSRHTGEFGIAILQEYWGFGIGTYLIQHLIHWAKQSNVIKKINLTVICDNTSAVKLYEKLGFNIEGKVTRSSLIDGVYQDLYWMGLEIE